MSRMFGPMRQIGFVVRDIEKAMDHWIRVCGIGPWFYAERYAITEFVYRGKRYDDLVASVAMSHSGEMQIELIQQRSETPSMFRDFIRAGHEGMHHWAAWPEEYDAVREKALQAGFKIGQEGSLPRGRYAFFEDLGVPGAVVELSEMTPARREISPRIQAAALNWDGRDPIRRV